MVSFKSITRPYQPAQPFTRPALTRREPTGPSTSVIIDRLILTTAESNCYMVAGEHAREAMVIDPSDDAERISHRLHQLDFRTKLVVITHAHWDHVNAAGALSARCGAPVALHSADIPLLPLILEVTRDRTGVLGPEPPTIAALAA